MQWATDPFGRFHFLNSNDPLGYLAGTGSIWALYDVSVLERVNVLFKSNQRVFPIFVRYDQ